MNTKGDYGGALKKAELGFKVGAGIDLGNEQGWCEPQEVDSPSSSSKTGQPTSALSFVYLSLKISCDAESSDPWQSVHVHCSPPN